MIYGGEISIQFYIKEKMKINIGYNENHIIIFFFKLKGDYKL